MKDRPGHDFRYALDCSMMERTLASRVQNIAIWHDRLGRSADEIAETLRTESCVRC